MTVTLAEAVPPRPVHSSVKVVDAVSGPEVSEPDTGIAPLQPPDAWHESALVLDQVSVVVPPDATSIGSAWSVTVGAGVLRRRRRRCKRPARRRFPRSRFSGPGGCTIVTGPGMFDFS